MSNEKLRYKSSNKNVQIKMINNIEEEEEDYNLNEFDKNIIIKRYEEGLTQNELSQELGINQVKVSRKEKEILTRLRTRLR